MIHNFSNVYNFINFFESIKSSKFTKVRNLKASVAINLISRIAPIDSKSHGSFEKFLGSSSGSHIPVRRPPEIMQAYEPTMCWKITPPLKRIWIRQWICPGKKRIYSSKMVNLPIIIIFSRTSSISLSIKHWNRLSVHPLVTARPLG